jgi:hypothetical protein
MMDNEWGWTKFTAFFAFYLTERGIQEDWVPHIKDLGKQVFSYKESIKSGHGVIVIAHSQGNYYTNEAYELLPDWMRQYFHMMGVATPANHVAGFAPGDTTAPYVKFHNDFINVIVTSLPANRDDTRHHGFPSIDAHDFYESYLKEPTTRSDIQQFIIKNVQNHLSAPSQWSTDQEFDRGTCDYRITVKHRFDPALEIGEKVYPFAPNQKLYQVNGEYVKATCGGTDFTDDWADKKENECWMINNPPKEKIRKNMCFIVNNEEYCETGTFVHSYTTGTGYYPSVWHKKAGSNMRHNIDWAYGLNPYWDTSRVKWTVSGVYPYGVTFVVKYDDKEKTFLHQKHTRVKYTAQSGATLEIGNVDIHQGCNIRVKYPGDEDKEIGEYKP